MLNAKRLPTPMVSNSKLTKYGGNYMAEPTLYRSVVGVLQYATITRPEICYNINKVCQFLSQPLDDHSKAVKRILQHLKGTISHGFIIKPEKPNLP